ncbi:MAG: hypothetical protein OXF42_02305 [Candidatus Dadabacteria bacterium]|nr:hypothetical protein [Candidatus Dadabacteria bacterium]
MNWIDYAVSIATLAGFTAGVAGMGLINLLIHLSAVAACATAGYIFASSLTGGGAGGMERLMTGALIFIVCFAGWLTIKKIAGKIPGVTAVMRLADGILGAAVLGAAAVITVAVAETRVPEVRLAAEQSVIYQKAFALASEASEGEPPWKK